MTTPFCARCSAILLLLAVLFTTTAAHAQSDWDVVLNGRSVHINAAKDWNEENWVKLAMANGFKDSDGDPSYMAGGGLKRRFKLFSDHAYFDVGVIGFLMTRQDVRHNQPFPGVLPAMTFGGKRVACFSMITLPLAL